MTNARERQIAKDLGVTPTGLAMLGRAAARSDGELGGGMGSVKLEAQGYATPRDPERRAASAYTPCIITDAGREIVRRARQMGW